MAKITIEQIQPLLDDYKYNRISSDDILSFLNQTVEKESVGKFDKNGDEIFVGDMLLKEGSYPRFIKNADGSYGEFKWYTIEKVTKSIKGNKITYCLGGYVNDFYGECLEIVASDFFEKHGLVAGEYFLLDDKTGKYFNCKNCITISEYISICKNLENNQI